MRTLENTSIGSVVAPGPETKLAITRSSSDRVNASIQPEISAGAIIGKVMTKNTFSGGAPNPSPLPRSSDPPRAGAS